MWAAGDARSEQAEPASADETPTPARESLAVGVAATETAPVEPEQLAVEPPQLVGDPAAGATKAAVCAGCHGPDGNALAPIFPNLAGQRSDYIAKQLHDFKAGQRVDPVMAGMAAMLSDQDIADVAAYFESGTPNSGSGDPMLVAAGERIYRKGRPEIGLLPCIGCHGPNGKGANGAIDGGFPALGGQNPDYLMKQLQSFRGGSRANDWKGIMQIIASRLSDEDIAALIAYVNSLPQPTD
ncbi:MAG: cytochrome c4 [Deltaproteobacteria bacterium]|nr:cytochrome c4 [Deltaproteobacteria bacterium]